MTATFYIVWNPCGPTAPRRRHEAFDSAAAEAERLALTNPGDDFFVMQAHRRVRTTKPLDVEDFDTCLEPPF